MFIKDRCLESTELKDRVGDEETLFASLSIVEWKRDLYLQD